MLQVRVPYICFYWGHSCCVQNHHLYIILKLPPFNLAFNTKFFPLRHCCLLLHGRATKISIGHVLCGIRQPQKVLKRHSAGFEKAPPIWVEREDGHPLVGLVAFDNEHRVVPFFLVGSRTSKYIVGIGWKKLGNGNRFSRRNDRGEKIKQAHTTAWILVHAL